MSQTKDTNREMSQGVDPHAESVIEGSVTQKSSAESKSDKPAQSTFKKHSKSDTSKASDMNAKDSNKPQKSQTASSSAKSSTGAKQESLAVAPKKTSRLLPLLLWLLVILGAVLMIFVFQNGQAIDELRNDLNQVQSKQTTILDQQDSILAESGSNKTVDALQTKFEQLQSSVNSLQQQVPKTQSQALNTDEIKQQQAEFESALQSKLEQMQTQIETMNTPTQTAEGEVDLTPVLQKIARLEQQLTALQAEPVVSEEPASSDEKQQSFLSLQGLQQSIFETNTQWLLGASAAATIEKLNAIEKMAVNGGLPEITVLSRLIGEDVAYLKDWYEIDQQPLPSLAKLKQAVGNIAPPKISLQQAEKTPVAVESEVNSDALAVGEVAEQQSAWARLLNRLGEMVTIKNRQTTGEPTTVEALLQHDIQKQRLMLLIEQMRWSAERDSQARFESAIDQVQKFVNVHFASHSAQFETLLKPFRAFERQERKTLATAAFHVKPEGQ